VFDLANETDAAEWALGHDCEVFPTQYELKALKLAAEVACTNRGHEMVWHDTIGNTNIAECKHCEAWVQVNTSPAPNQIDIGGPAVALDCKE
jgi:predicted methyltransferase